MLSRKVSNRLNEQAQLVTDYLSACSLGAAQYDERTLLALASDTSKVGVFGVRSEAESPGQGWKLSQDGIDALELRENPVSLLASRDAERTWSIRVMVPAFTDQLFDPGAPSLLERALVSVPVSSEASSLHSKLTQRFNEVARCEAGTRNTTPLLDSPSQAQHLLNQGTTVFER